MPIERHGYEVGVGKESLQITLAHIHMLQKSIINLRQT